MRFFDLATLSMTPTSGIVEAKIPLWWADGTSVSTTSNGYLQDGSTALSTNLSASGILLFKLSSNFPTNLQYALEASMYTSNASYNASLELEQIAGGTVENIWLDVVSSSTTMSVVRSGKNTLVPNNTYGLLFSTSGATAYISDASLIVFPQ